MEFHISNRTNCTVQRAKGILERKAFCTKGSLRGIIYIIIEEYLVFGISGKRVREMWLDLGRPKIVRIASLWMLATWFRCVEYVFPQTTIAYVTISSRRAR